MANRALLSERQIQITAPQDVRKEWLPKFFKYCNNLNMQKNEDLLSDLTSIAPQQGLWILTEENIIGVSNDLVTQSGLYPAASERIKNLVKIFKNAEISLFFSIRSYESFYRSAHSEVTRNRGYLPFEEFYDEIRYSNNSWFETVRMFQDALPQEKITLWKFEDFRSILPKLVQALTGLDDIQILLEAYKPHTTRPSLSQKTLDILSELNPVLSRKESLALVERINRAYPISPDCPNYRPFNPKQESIFQEQYQLDIQKIKASFPAIRFIEPSK